MATEKNQAPLGR